MPPGSKISVAATKPTKFPDKSESSCPSNGLPSNHINKPTEASGLAPARAQDGQKQVLQNGDEKIEKATSCESPSLSPTRSGSLLRRSSRRIPERQHERIVPLPAAKDIHGLGRLTPPGDGDDVRPKLSAQAKEVEPESDGLSIEPALVIEKQEDVSKELEEEYLDKPFEFFYPPGPVTNTPPDSPRNIYNHQPTFPTIFRSLASKSGFSDRLDTISECSAESESSEPSYSRPVSLASTEGSQRFASVQVDDPAPSPLSPSQAQDLFQTQDEEIPALSLDPPSLPPPTPPQPPLPAPAPAAIIEQASSDSSIAADLRAIGAYTNTISSDCLSATTTLRGSTRLSREAFCQSIDSVLNGSILSPSASQMDNVKDRLRVDHVEAQGILSSLARPQPPDNIIDTANLSVLLAQPPRPSPTQIAETSKPGESVPASERSQGSAQKEPVSRVPELHGQTGRESRDGKGLDAGDSFQQSGQSETNYAKSIPRAAPSSHGQEDLTANSQENSFQPLQLSKMPSGAKLGLDFGIPMSSSSSQYSTHSSVASNKKDGYEDEDDQDGDRDGKHREETLTPSLASALHTQGRQGPYKLMPQETDIFAILNDPIIPFITRFYAEERMFCRRVVSFTCDPRAVTAAACVPSPQRNSFRRVRKQVSEFVYEIQRYCLKYVAGYDLSWQIKKIQAQRQRQGSGTGVGTNTTLGGGGYRNSHDDGSGEGSGRLVGKGQSERGTGERPRGRKDGAWPAHRLLIAGRDCGCERGSCSSAGSSQSKKQTLDVEGDTNPLTSLLGDDNRQHADTNKEKGRGKYANGGTEMPTYMSRPPTPPRARESPARLQSYGFWQRVTGQDKGKRVERPPADEGPVTKPKAGADEPNGSEDEKSIHPEVKGVTQRLPQPTKNEKNQPLYDDCPQLPKLALERESVETFSQEILSSTPGSRSQSAATSTSGTPTTPRTRISSPHPEDNLPPAPAPPLPEKESFSIQYAVHMATDAILSLRNFMDLLEDTYYEAQPDPDDQTQSMHPQILEFCLRPYADIPQQPGAVSARKVERTPTQSAAYSRYQDLIKKTDNHATATVLVLEEQTKTIKEVLDAADPQPSQKQPVRPSNFPSLLRREKNLANGDFAGECMMSGALPNPDNLGSILVGSEDEDDDVDSQRTRTDNSGGYYPRRLSLVNFLEHRSNGAAPANRHGDIARPSARTGRHPQSNFRKSTVAAPNGNNTKNLARILDSRVVSAKLSYALARAEFISLKQLSRFSSLDGYTYRSLMRFENRLEQLEDDLLGLENRRFSFASGSSAGAGKRGSGGTRFGSGAVGCSGALAPMVDVPSEPDPSSSGGDSHAPAGGDHTSPSQSTATSSTKGTSPGKDSVHSIQGVQGNPASTPRSPASKTPTSSHAGSPKNIPKGGVEKKSAKSKVSTRDGIQNINQTSTTTKNMRRSVQKMYQAAESMVSIIIARRKGRRIGIADTEERQSLNSQEWDWFDSATGEVIPSPGSVRATTGRQISRGANHAERRSGIQHASGCPYGGDSGAGIYAGGKNGPKFRLGSAEPGIGLGLGLGALGGATVVGASPGSTLRRSGSERERKSHPDHGGSAITGSSPVSIPANVSPGSSRGRGRQWRCPGCGVDLGLTASRDSPQVPRMVSDGLPHTSQGGSSQLGWVRRVMGPRGRKRASRYWFYHPSFRTPLRNGTEQDEDAH